MVDAVSSQIGSQNSGVKAAANNKILGSYNVFLQLLTTQLKTQNPLNPMDASQFTQQLATFASLEQQVAANSKLDGVLNGINAQSLSNGVAYIGKTITATGNTITVGSDGKSAATLNYTLDSAASSAKLSILDSQGKVVWTGTGDPTKGSHPLAWNGRDSEGKTVSPGDYTLKVSATDADGKDVGTSTGLTGKVTAVDSSSGATVLDLGGTKVKISAVTRLTA